MAPVYADWARLAAQNPVELSSAYFYRFLTARLVNLLPARSVRLAPANPPVLTALARPSAITTYS